SQLREQAARVLRLPAASLDAEVPLNHLGIDSLMAIELKNRIEADLGVSVPMVKFLEGPSVRDLAGFLADRLAPAELTAAPPSANPAAGPEALRRSFDELAARHESLRATFPERPDGPVLVVSEPSAVALPIYDAAHWTPEELDLRLHAQAHLPFELARGPVHRAALFRRAD